MRVLIVGDPAPFHVGHHFLRAAVELGFDAELLDVNLGYSHGLWQKLMWRLDKRAARQSEFEHRFANELKRKWDLVLVTGISPLGSQVLAQARMAGTPVVNFLTDDPWNPAHRRRWFFDAIGQYAAIATPRQANRAQLGALNPNVFYMPFAYNPEVHYAQPTSEIDCDVLFVGGCDKDRIPFVKALADAGNKVWVYGGYWQRLQAKSVFVKGHGDVDTIRRVTAGARLSLILVRRANRDGHVMRSLEAAASGGCLMVEDTPEHREIFGDCVYYFRDIPDLVRSTSAALAKPGERRNRAERLRELMQTAGHTYRDRLLYVLEQISRMEGLKC